MSNINYETLMAQINALTKQAEAIRTGEVSTVIEDIKTKMNDYGISITDLQFRSSNKDESIVVGRVIHSRRKPEAKYVDASTGQAWTGRGKLPVWIKQAINQGKNKDDFLVKEIFKDNPKKLDSKVETQNADGKVIHRRRKPEAKYVDSSTGQSWSGRGKTPKWLKAAMVKGKNMEQFAVA